MPVKVLKATSANIIQKWRKENRLSVKGMAKILDVSDKSLEAWEKGEAIPNRYSTARLAALMGVDATELEYTLKGKEPL